MKLLAVRAFAGRTADQMLKYLSGDLARTLKDLSLGLRRLTFAENFQTFSHTFTVGDHDTVQIPNRLGAVDLEWVVVDISGDSRLVRDATTPWTAESIYLYNTGLVSVTATVRFFRGE